MQETLAFPHISTFQGAAMMEVIANQLTMYEERLAQQTREFRQTQVLAHQAAFCHTLLQVSTGVTVGC